MLHDLTDMTGTKQKGRQDGRGCQSQGEGSGRCWLESTGYSEVGMRFGESLHGITVLAVVHCITGHRLSP